MILSIIAVAYLTFSTGLTVNFHYCMGEMDTITISGKVSDTCGKCGMHTEKSKGCCSDEISIYKIKDDQKQNQIFENDFSIVTDILIILYPEIGRTIYTSAKQVYRTTHSPPLLKDRCILNQVFRI